MRFLLVFSILFVISCQKTNYLYFEPRPSPPVLREFSHLVKDIQGEKYVDILWVIDNSGSMGQYQKAVASNVAYFMNEFIKTKLDWKMALISTDFNDRPFLGMLPGDDFKYTDPNPVGRFQNAVSKLGIYGLGIEMTFVPVRTQLRNYPKFIRNNAMLAILIATDASEHSWESNSPYIPPPHPTPMRSNDFLNLLTSVKGNLNRTIVYGAFGSQDLKCPNTYEFHHYKGGEYEKVVNATHGKYFPLCAKDFGTQLATIGKDLSTRVQNPKIYLKNRPITSSLKVFYLGNEIPGGSRESGGLWVYDYDANAVLFHNLEFAKGDTEKVVVQYLERG